MSAAASTAPTPAICEFFLHGVPKPKGSLERNHYGKAYWPPAVMAWCRLVKMAAMVDFRNTNGPTASPRIGPIVVTCEFVFERPKSHGKRFGMGKKAGAIPPACTSHQLGDLDKLVRGILDPLVEAGVLLDDSHVTEVRATKRYAASGEGPGVAVRVAGV